MRKVLLRMPSCLSRLGCPGEFMARPFGPPMHLSFFNGQLVINSNNKMTYFTPDGRFIKEEKAPPNAVFIWKKNGYLGIGAALAHDSRPFNF